MSSSRPYLTALAMVLILGVGIYFRLHDLAARNLWTDEAWVALAAMKPSASAALAASQTTPPLYLLAVWAAAKLWGPGEAVLRGLSLLFGVGTLWVVWRFSRVLVNASAALLTLAAVAVSPVMVYYSKELKQYSGDAFFAVLVLWLTERLLARQGQKGWLALALAGALGLGFSHSLIFVLPVAGAVLWAKLPRQRGRLVSLAAAWTLGFVVFFLLFFRAQVNPELVIYWAKDFPNFSGFWPFLRWSGDALYRYAWYFLGEWGMVWGPVLLLASVIVLERQGRSRVLLYLVGPLLLAFGAACMHRYPFMAHYGGNRLMLFSAPVLYLIIAAGGVFGFTWLWRRRQRLLSLALTGFLLVALHPLANLREDLSPLNNREQIQPLVAYLETHLKPRDMVYVYYFAVAPFKYYYQGPTSGVCWGRSCVEQDLKPGSKTDHPPSRLWLIASHIPNMKFLRQFAAKLLGPHWQETACLTREGAVLCRFDRRDPAPDPKTPSAPPAPPESGPPTPSADTVYRSAPTPPPS